jgi:hypothetical protein
MGNFGSLGLNSDPFAFGSRSNESYGPVPLENERKTAVMTASASICSLGGILWHWLAAID